MDVVEQLIEALSDAVDQKSQELAKQIADAAIQKDYAKVASLSKKGRLLENFKAQVARLAAEWKGLLNEDDSPRSDAKLRTRADDKTPAYDFAIPVLEALVELGGSGRVSDVANIVYRKVADRLRPADFEIDSYGRPAWQASLHVCRLYLVKRGLMKEDSPKGIWEISDAGRQYYDVQKRTLG